MYGDPSTTAASSGASLTGQQSQSHSLPQPSRSQSLSQSLSQPPPTSTSSYPSASLSLTSSNRTSPFAPATLAPTVSTAFTTSNVIAPPASSSMAAVYYPTHQPIGQPLSAATPAHPSSFAQSFEREAPNPIGTRQPAVDQAHAVLVSRLPPETTEQNLRVMCIFADELLDVNMLGVTSEPDGNYCSAILRFKSYNGAQEAQTILNGKKGMRVDHIGTRPHGASDRSKSGPSSGASSTTSPGTAATQPPRFDGTFSPLEKTSPSMNGNYVTSDFAGAKPSYYRNVFSPHSPIGNHLSEQPRNTGKSLINDATDDDDDTGDILQLPRAFGENGAVPAQRRATAPQIPIMDRMASLSLNTGPAANGAPSSQRGHGQPSTYQPHSTHANTMSPAALNGTNGHYQSGPMPWRTNVPPPANPADMNPPCNTLYVGNLPMGSSEDELKSLFSKQRGYKRLCFRAKANGPMCFVEFDDISCATRTLNELYGFPLSNSIKGGIRLSFSKNPLGVRSPQTPGQGPPGPLAGPNGLMNHSTNGFAPAGPPPGLAAPPGLNGNRTTGPYPASAVQNGSNPSSSYPPATMPNGSILFGNSGGAPSYGGNTWGSNTYFASTSISAPTGVTSPPPLPGAQNAAQNGAIGFNTYRRGQF